MAHNVAHEDRSRAEQQLPGPQLQSEFRGLQAQVKTLHELVAGDWQKYPRIHHVDRSHNIVRDVYLKKHQLLENLFRAAQAALPYDTNRAQTLSRNADLAEIFRERILGTSATKTRAKILATVLSQGAGYLLEAWAEIRAHVVENEDPVFIDESLPFDETQLDKYLKAETVGPFCRHQHEFCPVDLRELDINFQPPLNRLRTLINDYATFKCVSREKDGKTKNDPRDEWTSAVKLQSHFAASGQDVKHLYIGFQNIESRTWAHFSGQELRDHHSTVMRNANAFFVGLKSRERLFAILICSNILWNAANAHARHNFTRICINAANGCEATTLSDEDLPLNYDQAIQYFADDGLLFVRTQLRFCPVTLRPGKPTDWDLADDPPLPLLEKTYIDEGGSGRVYRVKIAAGYYHEARDQIFAMKVIGFQGKANQREWRIATIRAESNLANLVLPVTCVLAPSKTYYFMTLAECNLENLMRGPKEGRVVHASGEMIAETGDEGEEGMVERCHSSVPKYYENRRARLEWMIGLADGIRNLHLESWPHYIFHGDIKPANILYMRDQKRALHLSDFGISMIQYAPQSELQATMYTTLNLGQDCSNYPPEADLNRHVDGKVDIWSFGIVFAEFVAWISGGRPALLEFANERAGGDIHMDHVHNKSLSWFKSRYGHQRLKPGIETWYDGLIARSEGPDKKLYEDCWMLLRVGLLRCNPAQRLDASHLCEALGYLQTRQTKKLRSLLQDTLNSGPHRSPTPDQSVPYRTSTQASSKNEEPVRSESSAGAPRASRTDTALSSRSSIAEVWEALKTYDGKRAAGHITSGTNVTKRIDGDTLLHRAVLCRTTDATKVLMEHFPDLADQKDASGRTPLHRCARDDGPSGKQHAELLIGGAKTRLEATDKQGRTAVDIAREKGRRAMVLFLEHKWRQLNGNQAQV